MEERYRAFVQRAREQGKLVAQGYTPGFVLKFASVIMTTKATSAAVHGLVLLAADPKIRPSDTFLEELLGLRIPRAELNDKSRERYIWRADLSEDDTVSLGEWMQTRGYRRRESSTTLERVAPAAPV